jgi:hypothetical protein
VKSLTEHLWFETPHRRDYLNITDTIAQLVRKSAVQEGLCLVNAMHITVSAFVDEAVKGLLSAAEYRECIGEDDRLEKWGSLQRVNGCGRVRAICTKIVL